MFLFVSFELYIKDYGISAWFSVKDAGPLKYRIADHRIGVTQMDKHGGH